METSMGTETKPKAKKTKSMKVQNSLNETIETKHRYIYCRKDDQDPTARLIEELLMKCNLQSFGAHIDFSVLVTHAMKMIGESDILEIQNGSLSDEDRARAEVLKYNTKHGTNYTMFEFVLNGLLKKSKKGAILLPTTPSFSHPEKILQLVRHQRE